jgi:hypothetical protein
VTAETRTDAAGVKLASITYVSCGPGRTFPQVDDVPSAGIEPAARGLGNRVSTDMAGDRRTFPLVDALQVLQSPSVNRRC